MTLLPEATRLLPEAIRAAPLWPLLTLAGLLAGVGGVVVAGVVVGSALQLLRPRRLTGGRAVWLLGRVAPGDLGIDYEDVAFDVPDAASPGRTIRLAAWWMPATRGGRASERCCVVLHGYGDAKVGGIAWAPTLLSLGWNVLAVDLRAHGESGGRDSTAGFYERHDVAAVLDRLRAERPGATRHLAIFGVSLGAAVAVAVAAERSDVDALVLECPFADYRSAVDAWAGRMRSPLPSLRGRAVRLAEWWSGADFAAVAPERLLPGVRCPVLAVFGGADPFVSAAERDRVVAALPAGSSAWVVDGAAHVRGLEVDPVGYRERVGAFLAVVTRSDALEGGD